MLPDHDDLARGLGVHGVVDHVRRRRVERQLDVLLEWGFIRISASATGWVCGLMGRIYVSRFAVTCRVRVRQVHNIMFERIQ